MTKKIFLKNKLIIIVLIIIILLILILFLRFFIGGNEDNWICVNGRVVKHGNPNYQPNINCEKKNLIGGQRDKHGCLIPAGYSWCESKKKCLRVWEEPCSK
jgi:hypothetical protein